MGFRQELLSDIYRIFVPIKIMLGQWFDGVSSANSGVSAFIGTCKTKSSSGST